MRALFQVAWHSAWHRRFGLSLVVLSAARQGRRLGRAQRLGYRLGQQVVLSHGSGEIPGNDHGDQPFTVVGILAPTGTPVDRSVHIGLAGMEVIHRDWVMGMMPSPGMGTPADKVGEHDLTPKTVTAVLVGLKSRAAVFAVQRRVAAYDGEPPLAVLPGVALDELWDAIDAGERALLAMSGLVAAVSLAGLVAVIVTGLEQRRRELAVLRSIGAGPAPVFALLVIEGALVTAIGAALGVVACSVAIALLGPPAHVRFGVRLSLGAPTPAQWLLLAAVLMAGTLVSVLPGWRAYRISLAQVPANHGCGVGKRNTQDQATGLPVGNERIRARGVRDRALQTNRTVASSVAKVGSGASIDKTVRRTWHPRWNGNC